MRSAQSKTVFFFAERYVNSLTQQVYMPPTTTQTCDGDPNQLYDSCNESSQRNERCLLVSYDEADKTPTKLARHLRGQDGVHSPATSVADDADVHFALTDDAYAKKVLPDSATVVDVTHQGGYTEVWARWE